MDDDFTDFEEAPVALGNAHPASLPPLAPGKLSLGRQHEDDDADSRFDEHENHLPSDDSEDSLSFNEPLAFDVDVKLSSPQPDRAKENARGGQLPFEASSVAAVNQPSSAQHHNTSSLPRVNPTGADDFDDFSSAVDARAQVAVPAHSPLVLPAGRWSRELLSMPPFTHVGSQLTEMFAQASAPVPGPDPMLLCARAIEDYAVQSAQRQSSKVPDTDAAVPQLSEQDWAVAQAAARDVVRKETEKVMLRLGLVEGEPIPTRAGAWPLRYGPLHDMWAGRKQAVAHTRGPQQAERSSKATASLHASTADPVEQKVLEKKHPVPVHSAEHTAAPAAAPQVAPNTSPASNAESEDKRAAAVAAQLLREFTEALPKPRA